MGVFRAASGVREMREEGVKRGVTVGLSREVGEVEKEALEVANVAEPVGELEGVAEWELEED